MSHNMKKLKDFIIYISQMARPFSWFLTAQLIGARIGFNVFNALLEVFLTYTNLLNSFFSKLFLFNFFTVIFKITSKLNKVYEVLFKANIFSFFYKVKFLFSFDFFSFGFFGIFAIVQQILKPIWQAVNFLFISIVNIGDFIKAHQLVFAIFSFFFKKISYIFWYIKKYWIYRPLRFFYIYFFLYILNMFPKNRDYGFEDTFFFRGYKLYTIDNKTLKRRHLFLNGQLKVITPEGLSWKRKAWYQDPLSSDMQILKNNRNFFLKKASSKKKETDFSIFFNIWSKTKTGRFWFLKKDVLLQFPRINEFSFGTEWFRVLTYKSWKHSFITRLLYQAPFRKNLVTQRMLDYSSSYRTYTEGIFRKRNSFSYFFSFKNEYFFLPYKGEKNINLNKWAFSEKFLFNRSQGYGFAKDRSILKKIASYYANVSQLKNSRYFYKGKAAKNFKYVKAMRDFYTRENRAFHYPYMKQILRHREGFGDVLAKKTQRELSLLSSKFLRNYLKNKQTNNKNTVFQSRPIKATWSNGKIFSFLVHKKRTENKAPGAWDSFFLDIPFYGVPKRFKFIERIYEIFHNYAPEKDRIRRYELFRRFPKPPKNTFSRRKRDKFRHSPFNFDNSSKKTFAGGREKTYTNLYHYTKKKEKKNKDLFQNDLFLKDLENLRNTANLGRRYKSKLFAWAKYAKRKATNQTTVNQNVLTQFLPKKRKQDKKNTMLNLNERIQIAGIGRFITRKKSKKRMKRKDVNSERYYNAKGSYLSNLFSYRRAPHRHKPSEIVDFARLKKHFVSFEINHLFKDDPMERERKRTGMRYKYKGPNTNRLYNFIDYKRVSPEFLERMLFTNTLYSQFNFVRDDKYLHNNYFYQVYPALFNRSYLNHYITEEYRGSRLRPALDNEEDDDSYFSLSNLFEFESDSILGLKMPVYNKMKNDLKQIPFNLTVAGDISSQPMRGPTNKEEGNPTTLLLKSGGYHYMKKIQVNPDKIMNSSKFYPDSIRYSDIKAIDFLQKRYRKGRITKNSFFSSSSIINDIKNYRLNQIYSKLFFEKKYREQNFFNSKMDRSFVQKEKPSTLTYPSGKLKAPNKYDYYFVNKVGNRGFIEYKAASKFLNENHFVNYLKFKESQFFSYIWNEMPSNFLFVEIKYVLIDFFHNKCGFLNYSFCFTITRVLLTMSDRFLYEVLSAIKIYVISWFSVVVDDIVGVYMRYYLLLLDPNTLLFISRKNVNYQTYTIVTNRDRSFENSRLFGLIDMRKRFYKGVGVQDLVEGPKSEIFNSSNDIYNYNSYIKMYTKIRGTSLGVYEHYLAKTPGYTDEFRHLFVKKKRRGR